MRKPPAGAPSDWTGQMHLEAGPQAVGVVSAVASVTQQHVVGVAFAPADAAASVEDGAGPEDGALQAGQVDKHLQHTHTNTHTIQKKPSY